MVIGWFCIRFHFFIQASFIVDTEGWYCVTNGNIFPPCFVLGVQTPFVNFISFIPVHQGFFFNFNYFPQRLFS